MITSNAGVCNEIISDFLEACSIIVKNYFKTRLFILKSRKSFFILVFLILSLLSSEAIAITRAEFLNELLKARGIDWSQSVEFSENRGGAIFLLRTGIITEGISGLNSHVTKREAIRWIIESLGLKFEAELLSDYPTDFSDIGNLSSYERGCLVVASKMNPRILDSSKNALFKGNNVLNQKEMNTFLERVRKISNNSFVLDVIRNPLDGFRVLIHREGVFSGIPNWRFYIDGFSNKHQAEELRKTLKNVAVETSISQTHGSYFLRTEKLDDYNVIRRLESFIKSRKLKYRILPIVSNPKSHILPKFWVMLYIDPSYWRILPLTAQGGVKNLDVLSSMNKNNGAKASINAGFFAITKAKHGFPIGALKINGKILSPVRDGRGTLGWNDNDEAIFAISAENQFFYDDSGNLMYSINPDFISNANTWHDMTNIIQAGPLLLDNGIAVGNSEGFNSALLSARHPRSAVGLSSEGQWIFLAVDGRNGLHASGATISELTEIFKSQNIPHALNLDGGGSTEIIINGRIYNSISEGKERMISYALGALKLKK